jgi:tripartite-type tricarboxylate transporter receptor subunit TctC
LGAGLSDAASAVDRRLWRWLGAGHPCAIDRSIAIGATRAVICRREPQWRQQQHCHRRCGQGIPGRLHAPSHHVINATLYDKLNYNFIRDIVPIASIVRVPLVMEVHPSVPARTVAEFIAYAKANPGKINMASAATGGLTHVAGELFKMMAGVDLFHVPYRGAQVFPALLAGEAQVYVGPLLSSIGYVRAGNLRALAVTTTTRSPVLPDIPALSETLPGYEASTWYGIGAPKNTPAEIIKRLNTQVNASLADANFQARLANLGATVLPGSPADFGKLIADETEKWAKVIRAANIKAE